MKNIIIYIFIALLFQACTGCSKSGRRKVYHADQPLIKKDEEIKKIEKETVVKMEKINGVYEIPTEIDEIPMHFIFDTGAGIISISNVEATFLYKQGKLTEDDIIGKANFTDAEGNVTEGTRIILKTVKIGDRILENVEASVVNNLNAPLLMGQSALEKFGKISIDYSKGEITFQ